MFHNGTSKSGAVVSLVVSVFLVACSGVNFSGSPQSKSVGESTPVDSLGQEQVEDLPADPSVVGEEPLVQAARTCTEFIADAANAMDLGGQDLRENGNNGMVNVANGGAVAVNGNTDTLIIDGAKSVDVDGNVGNLCVRTQSATSINGNLAEMGAELLVIIGESTNGQRAKIDRINGNINSILRIFNSEVQRINGNFSEIHLDGSSVQTINGDGGDIHLYNGAEVIAIDGNVGQIIQH